MAVTQLASTSDVESAVGRTLTSSESALASFALDKASERFRRESGQQFTAGSSTVRLKVNGGRVYLTQRPVVTVTSVSDDDGDAVDYTLTGQWLDVALSSGQYVTVEYDHGGEVPDIVRLTIAEIAARNVNLDDSARAGLSQFSNVTGPFNESGSFAAWAVGGQVTLSPDDIALARSFRAVVPRVFVQAAPAPTSTRGTVTEANYPDPGAEV